MEKISYEYRVYEWAVVMGGYRRVVIEGYTSQKLRPNGTHEVNG